ncbi:putative lipid II flippase FtsW [Paenibacillus alginolyticus]|uniref:Probable peptidoglycan glycosyltransferase FtsW n=1 Tax=Paenibacillus alginolyticus TaxID=59839 RepID=A0ABT4GJA7_9BACL|nr:putative lipid II flippase FtsW [Paenibacillus alginolyticus]MCY9668037.1 putative lipid II flippase FtsW [Paenibacillus alginolyticus]MCY9696285.1 putative lipid II flippase FtsW [Paenibacillus alginolyticus]MEC0142560.1 putative lipid II flippase FtsW [Paenibacillus alginolyticus]
MNPPRRGTPDFLLLFLTFVLVCFGLAMVFSASSMTSAFYEKFNNDPWFFTKKQLMAVGIGTVGMLFCMNLHYSKLKKLVLPAFFVIVVLLVLVIFTSKANGAASWFNVGKFGIQPTEFAKLIVILYLASLISNKEEKFRNFKKGLLPALLIVGFVCFLIMLQPDFGSCMILLICAAIVIMVGGSNLKHIFFIGTGSVAIAAIGVALYLLKGNTNNNYRINRLTSFLDPFSDPQGNGLQVVQSLYAFGHGGLTGAGFGQGIQKLHYLPEAHTDFIFAIIGEELGFIGSALFILIFLIFLWRGILVAVRSPDMFGMLTGVGIMVMFALQAFINIGGVTNTIPLTGVTLPFISAGGSSMMVSLISMGILLSISREQTHKEDAKPKKRPNRFQ